MLSNFPAEQTVLPGCVPTATVFLSYLTNKARRRKSPGCPRAARSGIAGRLPGRRGQQSHASGEYLGAVGWGHGTRGWPRTAAPLPRGTLRSLRSGAGAPPPGRPVSAPGLSGRGSSPKLAGGFAAKVERERVRSPGEKGGSRKRRSRRGGRPGCRATPGAAHSPPTPAPPRRRRE